MLEDDDTSGEVEEPTHVDPLSMPSSPVVQTVPRLPRFPIRTSFTAHGMGGKDIKGRSFNISGNGIGLHLDEPLPGGRGQLFEVSSSAGRWEAKIAWKAATRDQEGNNVFAVGVELDRDQDLAYFENLVREYRPRILVIDPDDGTRELALRVLSEKYEVCALPSFALAWPELKTHLFAAFVVDLGLPGAAGTEFLKELREKIPGLRCPIIAINEYVSFELISPIYLDSRVFYCTQKPVPARELGQIVDGGVRFHDRISGTLKSNNRVHDDAQALLEFSSRLSVQREFRGASHLVEEAIIDLTGAERARCLFFDSGKNELWHLGEGGQVIRRAGTGGLVGYVCRTGEMVNLAHSGDYRYVPFFDDPQGTGGEAFLAVPVMSPDQTCLGVFCAIKPSRQGGFTRQDEEILSSFSLQAASTMSRVSLRARVLEDDESSSNSVYSHDIFRAEAVAEQLGTGDAVHGEILRVSSATTRVGFWAVFGGFAMALVFLAVAQVGSYASGGAVLLADQSTQVMAPSAGVVEEVHVKAGQQVARGQVLISLDAREEERELLRIEREYRAEMGKYLLDPRNESSVASLTSQREAAIAKLEDRVIRARSEGVISTVRVLPGQAIAAGDLLTSFVPDETNLVVTALFEAKDRPLLAPGMILRVTFQGIDAAQEIEISSVSEVLGPDEVKRLLGSSQGEVVSVSQPVTVVKARLTGESNVAKGQLYPGLQAQAEVRLGTQSVLSSLLPGGSR